MITPGKQIDLFQPVDLSCGFEDDDFEGIMGPEVPFEQCQHEHCIETQSVVPCGIACLDCDTVLSQFIPLPPEVLGYESADWAWKHKYGTPYTYENQSGDNAQ